MLKVMTFNINSYNNKHGPWSVRRELIRDAIQDADPHVVALQAVRREPGVELGMDQAAQLSALLPDYGSTLFQPAHAYAGGGEDGLAFLARIPWQENRFQALTLLPDLDDKNRRVLLAATFRISGGPLHLFNAYFSWVDEQARTNVHEALLFINSVPGPGILLGDFNIPPGSDSLKPLSDAGWTDVWAQLHPGAAGETFIEDGRLAKRIDYVWVSQDLNRKVRSIDITGSRLHESGARASDHVGLLLTLDVEI